ncbi:MAG: DnaJ domain-containing protein [Planctomycetota bacterium]
MRCWYCEHAFDLTAVTRLGMMKGRPQERGGPFRTYRCPTCQRESRIEVTRGGRWFASPAKDIGIADFLFGWIEPLTPDDMLRMVDWHHRFADRRRHFFERDGDHRYSRRGLVDWLRRLWVSKSRRVAADATPANGPPQEGAAHDAAAGAEPPWPRTAPAHPYRVLGLDHGASEGEIRAAFRRLARRYHPDKLRDSDAKTLELASRRLAELVRAYDSLAKRDEGRRKPGESS